MFFTGRDGLGGGGYPGVCVCVSVVVVDVTADGDVDKQRTLESSKKNYC